MPVSSCRLVFCRVLRHVLLRWCQFGRCGIRDLHDMPLGQQRGCRHGTAPAFSDWPHRRRQERRGQASQHSRLHATANVGRLRAITSPAVPTRWVGPQACECDSPGDWGIPSETEGIADRLE